MEGSRNGRLTLSLHSKTPKITLFRIVKKLMGFFLSYPYLSKTVKKKLFLANFLIISNGNEYKIAYFS